MMHFIFILDCLKNQGFKPRFKCSKLINWQFFLGTIFFSSVGLLMDHLQDKN